jgi:BlaI family transcriptional regulator, penicillinase repressor
MPAQQTETPQLPQLAPAELDLMKVLWKAGRLSAREIHDRLTERMGWAYSTTRTVAERMVEKGLLRKAAFHGLNVYEPAVSRAAGLARLVRDFAEQVLELKRVPVAALFAESEALTPEELRELRALVASQTPPANGRRRRKP